MEIEFQKGKTCPLIDNCPRGNKTLCEVTDDNCRFKRDTTLEILVR